MSASLRSQHVARGQVFDIMKRPPATQPRWMKIVHGAYETALRLAIAGGAGLMIYEWIIVPLTRH